MRSRSSAFQYHAGGSTRTQISKNAPGAIASRPKRRKANDRRPTTETITANDADARVGERGALDKERWAPVVTGGSWQKGLNIRRPEAIAPCHETRPNRTQGPRRRSARRRHEAR